MAALVVTSGKDSGLFIAVARRPVVLGRDPATSLQVNDDKVSRKHAQVRFDEARGAYLVTDMTSANGTLVNGRRIESEEAIAFGGTVQIGDTVLTLTEEIPTDKANALEVVKRASERQRGTLMPGS
jgi:pSer/pThr/pTyr-binding forkhead associated (FHA) protein